MLLVPRERAHVSAPALWWTQLPDRPGDGESGGSRCSRTVGRIGRMALEAEGGARMKGHLGEKTVKGWREGTPDLHPVGSR